MYTGAGYGLRVANSSLDSCIRYVLAGAPWDIWIESLISPVYACVEFSERMDAIVSKTSLSRGCGVRVLVCVRCMVESPTAFITAKSCAQSFSNKKFTAIPAFSYFF